MVIVIPSLIGFLVIDWNACDKSLFVQGFLPCSRFDTIDTLKLSALVESRGFFLAAISIL